MQNNILSNSEFSQIKYFDNSSHLDQQSIFTCAQKLLENSPPHINEIQQGVCILMSRGAHYIASIFAAWHAGFYVVPLNTSWPIQKNLDIIERTKPAFILADDETKLQTDFPVLSKTFLFDDTLLIKHKFNGLAFGSLPPSEIAYVIFTSGSTGEPKGVVITAGAFRSYIDWTKNFFKDYSSSQRLLLTSELTFDITMGDIAFALAFGTDIGVAQHNSNIPSILAMIMKHQIDVLYSVPTTHLALVRFAKQKKGADLSSLDLVLSGGDRFPWQLVTDYMSLSARSHFYNVYGPTEVTINCFATRLDDKLELLDLGKPVPIGMCFNTLDYVLLDDKGVPSDEGELCVTGPQMMLGYHGDGDRTSDAFINDPRLTFATRILYRTGDICYKDGGLIYIKGRIDGLVKIRGYRIHPDEVSKSLDAIKGVDVSAVVPYGSQSKAALAAFVRKERNADLSKNRILEILHDQLPIYMIPSYIDFVEEFPLNQSGKIDKKKLEDEIK